MENNNVPVINNSRLLLRSVLFFRGAFGALCLLKGHPYRYYYRTFFSVSKFVSTIRLTSIT